MLTRREWLIAGACLLLFAAVVVFGLAPRLQETLTKSAQSLVAKMDSSTGGARFDRVTVTIDGQRALLSGTVRNEPDGRHLLQALTHDLRTSGNVFNPISKVSADGTLKVRPLQAGWLVAAVTGFDAEIVGVCATEREREALEASLRSRWPVWRGQIHFALQVDPRRFDESTSWLATVRALPAPETRGIKSARLLTAQIGHSWTDVPLVPPQAEKAPIPTPPLPPPLQALGITLNEWQERLAARHDKVLAHYQSEAAWQAEQLRLSQLPPAHVFLAKRQDQVLLRGEVFDLEAKRAVIAAIMAALPGTRILDDLRALGSRRPGPGIGTLNAAQILDGKDGKAFALGLPGKPWAPLDWETARESQPWSNLLPSELQANLLIEDSALLIDWLQGANAGIPTLPSPPQPAFLTLAVFQNQLILGGRLAEESLRLQIVSAIKRTYPSGYTLSDQITVSGSSTASESVQHTAQSIPVRTGDPLLFALARPGQAWQILPPTTVAALATLPVEETLQGLPAALIATAFENAIEEIRALGLSFPEAPTRGMETPDNKP
jgi:hypothetical protein